MRRERRKDGGANTRGEKLRSQSRRAGEPETKGSAASNLLKIKIKLGNQSSIGRGKRVESVPRNHHGERSLAGRFLRREHLGSRPVSAKKLKNPSKPIISTTY